MFIAKHIVTVLDFLHRGKVNGMNQKTWLALESLE